MDYSFFIPLCIIVFFAIVRRTLSIGVEKNKPMPNPKKHIEKEPTDVRPITGAPLEIKPKQATINPFLKGETRTVRKPGRKETTAAGKQAGQSTGVTASGKFSLRNRNLRQAILYSEILKRKY